MQLEAEPIQDRSGQARPILLRGICCLEFEGQHFIPAGEDVNDWLSASAAASARSRISSESAFRAFNSLVSSKPNSGVSLMRARAAAQGTWACILDGPSWTRSCTPS